MPPGLKRIYLTLERRKRGAEGSKKRGWGGGGGTKQSK